MVSGATTTKRRSGRPLSFDRQAALKQAMLLFWQYGYEATSLQCLTEAMRITPPSLYAAFGDKKQLFLEAVELYTTGGSASAISIIQESPTAREAVWNLLQTSAVALTGTDTPLGCMLISSATNCSPASADVQETLARLRIANETALREKIQKEIDEGALPPEPNAMALASLYMGVIQAMSTQARDGASRTKLLAMAEASLRAWPETTLARTPPKTSNQPFCD